MMVMRRGPTRSHSRGDREGIAENPETVTALLEQSGQLSALLDTLTLVEDSLDDEMVESLTSDATTLGLAAT